MLFDDLTCPGSEFQRVGTATDKVQVPTWVLTLEIDNKWKPDERFSLGLGEKKAWKIDMMVLQKKEFDRQLWRVWKLCEIEQEASEEITEVGQNGNTDEAMC